MWVQPIRIRLHNEHIRVLTLLSQYYLSQKKYNLSSSINQKLLQYDRCMEDAHRRLMYCYYCLNQTYLAIRQFYECQELLEDELGISPDDETIKLFNAIRSGVSYQILNQFN